VAEIAREAELHENTIREHLEGLLEALGARDDAAVRITPFAGPDACLLHLGPICRDHAQRHTM